LPEDLLGAVLTSELPIPKHVLVELARVDDRAARERLISLAKRNELTVRKIRSVRAAMAGGEADTSRRHSAGVRFNVGRIGKITHQLRLARQSGYRPIDHDRALLEALRQEIDEMLAAGADASV
jgi:ParB family transcriptional regulator, chromosome partitioning protein